MGSTLTAKYIIDRVNENILNEEFELHTEAKMIAMFNMTTRLIISLVPHAYTLIAIWQLAAGTRQVCPSVATDLIKLMCNCSDGTTETTPIYFSSEADLDELVPGWRSIAAAGTHDNWGKEDDMEVEFFVSPPSDGTGWVKGKIVATPPSIVYDDGGAWESETIPLSDTFSNAYLSGLEYTCYNEDRDFPGNMEKAESLYQKFMTDLGLKAGKEA